MAGYWTCSFFAAFLWAETKSRSIKTQKRMRLISSHLGLTSLRMVDKDLLYSQKRELFIARPMREFLRGQDGPILLR